MKLEDLKTVENNHEYIKFSQYFTDPNQQTDRLALYKEYVIQSGNNILLNQAKNEILMSVFGKYFAKTLKTSLDLAKESNSDAVKIIDELSEFKNIFKDYDVDSFESFIKKIENALSITEIDLIFTDSYISEEFAKLLQKQIVNIINEEKKPVETIDEFLNKFHNHPLLFSLQEPSETNKTLSYIDNGVLELGKYKDLVKIVLRERSEKQDESIDFFISYLIKEDLTIGIQKIVDDKYYQPWRLRELLIKINNNELINTLDVENAI